MDKDQENMIKEILQLKEENKLLQEEKANLNNDRELAGELGKTLLEQNKELESKLEEINSEYTSAITKMEEIKQQNHTFRTRLETESRAKEHHIFEIENIKERLQKQFEEESKMTQITNERKVKELRKEIDSLQSDFNKHLMMESQLKEKIEQQDEMLENVRKYNKQLQFAANFETDLEEQRRICTDLQLERDSLVMAMSDLKNIQEQLKFDNRAILEKYESLEEEMQEKIRQAQTWYNCLQEARQEAGELKAELDSLKADVASKNFKEKGNSLFGEVEDRRLELERKYLTMQTQHECLLKTHNITKQHLHKLKNQVAALLQVRGNTADVSQLQRLQKALDRKEGEVKILNIKLNSLEKKQAENSLSGRLKEFHDAFSDFGDKKDYVNFLELQLEDTKKKTADLQKELQTKTLVQLGESERLRHSETQLYNAESNLEKLKTENMRLKLRIEDLRMKLMKLQKEMKTKATGEAEVKPNKTSKQTVKQVMPKSKSMSSINKKILCIQQPLEMIVSSPAPKAPQETSTTTEKPQEIHVPVPPHNNETKTSASVKPVQKVIPIVKTKTTPENNQETNLISQSLFDETAEAYGITQETSTMSASLFDEIAAVDQGGVGSPVESQSGLRDPQANHVRIHNDISVDKEREEQDETKENSCLQKKTVQFKTSGDSSSSVNNKKVLGVRGQRQAPAVINVGKGATKNECAQQ
ncbi:protein Spindly-like isoform X2 [Actinia tenebrosa]|uniref:Protein Spindly-like isoform X2 n=1 Tax=Actinia tenebrosa TaxID=6105 RepID=A0A6P8H0Y4_ACTTE|nr:protein Spindly-like isoform X2 [Actinia tenebrosa]